jgi:hypothetical protein
LAVSDRNRRDLFLTTANRLGTAEQNAEKVSRYAGPSMRSSTISRRAFRACSCSAVPAHCFLPPARNRAVHWPMLPRPLTYRTPDASTHLLPPISPAMQLIQQLNLGQAHSSVAQITGGNSWIDSPKRYVSRRRVRSEQNPTGDSLDHEYRRLATGWRSDLRGFVQVFDRNRGKARRPEQVHNHSSDSLCQEPRLVFLRRARMNIL